MQIEAFGDWEAWRRVREADDERFNEQYRQRLAALAQARDGGLRGLCPACRLEVAWRPPDETVAVDEGHREGLACPQCRLPARVRAVVALPAFTALPDAARVLLPEAGSPLHRWLRRRPLRLVASSFHPERRPLWRRLAQRWRSGPATHADLRALPLADGHCDAALVLEILEHVDGLPLALSELARVLSPGGWLLATAPFDEEAPDSRVQAEWRDGALHWFGAEDWHHDPQGGRVPCLRRFGWDLPGQLRAAGFADAAWCRLWSPAHGLFGLWVLQARR